MQIRIDNAAGRPVYQQIINQIKRDIALGRLDIDEQLPTVRQLAAQLAINPNTIAKAYRQLEQEGIIVTKPGAGAYVANLDSNNVSVLLGNGDGSFQSAVGYGAGGSSVSLAIGDLDGDGALDLAVANAFSDEVSVLINLSPGSTIPVPTLSSWGLLLISAALIGSTVWLVRRRRLQAA